MPTALPAADKIFAEALLRAAGPERVAYLKEACGNHPQLQERVERLLRAHDDAISFLETPPSAIVREGSPTLDQAPLEKPGTIIGPYKLLQQIGEGGMGVVYMAEQHEPVKRRVALKIIKPGMDSRQVIARFEAERQALSLMDHPNIAKVLDAGTTDSGRPYFVMELVKGQPITQYCDEKHLTPRQRLELLLPVCQAIQHAHQKGIIHRDIKPTNILVAEYDQQPVPKVIDFGVAKATSQTLTEKTMFTGLGQIVGTLEYMSPEQAKVNQLDIDTRSDIYSLGVLLYELLTGSTPFDRQRLRSAAFDEMLRIIREEEPPKPSTRLSDLSSPPMSSAHSVSGHAGSRSEPVTLASIAAQRQTEPAKLTKLIRGELDWIVMKALEKDRSRRYESASSLAADLQHFLNDEPVVACPPSAAYRLRKFVRRNKVSVLATSVVLVALIGVAGISLAAAMTYQRMAGENAKLAGDLKSALGDVERNLAQVKEKEQLAQKNLALATTEQMRAEGNLDLALKAMDAVYLDAIGTEKLLGEQVTREEGSNTITRSQSPLTDLERKLLQRGLSFYDQFSHENAATPRAVSQTAQAYYRVGVLQAALGDLSASAESYRAAIARFEVLTRQQPKNAEYWRQLSEAHFGLAWTCDKWEQARPSLEASHVCLTTAIARDNKNVALYMRRMDIAGSLNDFAVQDKDRDTILTLAPNDVNVLLKATHQMLHRRWPKSREQKSMATARELVTRAVTLEPNSALCHLRMAEVLTRTQHVIMFPHGKFRREILEADQALVHVSRAIEINPTLHTAYSVRAMIFESSGHYEKAISDINAAIRLKPDDIDLIMSRGLLHFNWEKDIAAEADFQQVLAKRPLYKDACHWLGCILMNRGEYEEALQWMKRAVAVSPDSYTIYKRIAEAQIRLGRFDDAVVSMETALSTYPDDLSTLWAPFMGQEVPANADFRNRLIELAERSIAKASDRAHALADRGTFFARIGDLERAERDFVEAEKVNPAAEELWGKWAQLEIKRGDLNRGLAMWDKQVAITPESWYAYQGRARVHLSLHRHEKALEDINRCIALHPRNAESLTVRSDVHASQGKLLEAMRDLREAMNCGVVHSFDLYKAALLSLADQNPEQYRAACRDMLAKFAESNNLEELHFTAWTAAIAPLALDDYGPAIALARRGLEINKESPEAIRSLGAILYRSGKFDEAVAQLAPLVVTAEKSSSEAKTSNAYPLYFLAMAQHQRGKKDDARAALQKVVELTKAELSDDKNPPAWSRKLSLELLQKEAEALIGVPAPPDASQAPKDPSQSSAIEIPTDGSNR